MSERRTNVRRCVLSVLSICKMCVKCIEQLIELETVKVVYKALDNEAPPYMKELFLKLSNTRCRKLRNSSLTCTFPV